MVKKVKQKLSSGVTISLVGSKMGKDASKNLDDSVQIITDTNDNESLSLEELDMKRSKPVGPEVEVNQNRDKPSGLTKPDLKPIEANQAQPKTIKEKIIEIQWTYVKRNKRKTRFFIFGSTVVGEKD